MFTLRVGRLLEWWRWCFFSWLSYWWWSIRRRWCRGPRGHTTISRRQARVGISAPCKGWTRLGEKWRRAVKQKKAYFWQRVVLVGNLSATPPPLRIHLFTELSFFIKLHFLRAGRLVLGWICNKSNYSLVWQKCVIPFLCVRFAAKYQNHYVLLLLRRSHNL